MRKTNISAKTPQGRTALAKGAKAKSPWSRQPHCDSKRAKRIFDELKQNPKK
ncbi:MAG: hypothetical protein KDI43_17820 [Gammaproteobacteria bacterium]|nr:hypothetical protein [Gammaproteobacteria bacterium]